MKKTGAPQRVESRASRGPAPSNVPARGIVLPALACLALLVVALTVFKMSNNDIWIHLRTGQIILETWQVPDKDPYSFTASDKDYVAHEWLSGVLFHLVYAAAGVNGLIVFKSAVILATCAALVLACRRLKARWSITLACFVGMLFIGSARFLERPHIFSYLFEALYLLCYVSFRAGGRRAWLYAIPLLHIVWTNLHGGHFQGIAMLVMFFLAEAVMWLRARRLGLAEAAALPARDVALVGALAPASVLTALVNPYGYRLLTFPFELTGQEVFMKGIYEWQSALFPSYNLSAMFLYYIVWTVALFGSFLLVGGHGELKAGWRSAAQWANLVLGFLWILFAFDLYAAYKDATVPTSIEEHAGLWLAVLALFLAANFHRLEFHHAGIAALFFALSLRHNRAVTDAVVATLPTLAHNLEVSAGRLRGRRPASARQEPWAVAAAAAVMIALAVFTWRNSYHFGFNPHTRREMGMGIASNMPVGAVDYIAANNIDGRAVPSYNAAAMLIHRTWPAVKVSMDSRNDVYGEALYEEYVAAMGGGKALEDYIQRWDPDFFLISYGTDRSPAFVSYLDASPEWTLVYFDDRQVVYLRDRPRFRPIIERDGYHLIRPAHAGPIEVRQEDGPRWLQEADRAVAAAPDSWSASLYRAKALLSLGRHAESLDETRRLLGLNSAYFPAWYDLGYLYLQTGQPGPAAQAFAACLEARPGHAPCRDALSRMKGPAP
ncbi:MAG TPA: hypothetical protein VJV23_13745 [Candidatus Polarisedimenticolia bacterium]|nr:hypothetical protein [Candidatus Polarisedimenticolia bacterium]